MNQIIKYLIKTVKSNIILNMDVNVRDKIKSLLALKCITITKLAEMMSEKTGEKYTFQRLSHKLRLGRLSLKEAYIIADLLDYKLEFIEK